MGRKGIGGVILLLAGLAAGIYIYTGAGNELPELSGTGGSSSQSQICQGADQVETTYGRCTCTTQVATVNGKSVYVATFEATGAAHEVYLMRHGGKWVDIAEVVSVDRSMEIMERSHRCQP